MYSLYYSNIDNNNLFENDNNNDNNNDLMINQSFHFNFLLHRIHPTHDNFYENNNEINYNSIINETNYYIKNIKNRKMKKDKKNKNFKQTCSICLNEDNIKKFYNYNDAKYKHYCNCQSPIHFSCFKKWLILNNNYNCFICLEKIDIIDLKKNKIITPIHYEGENDNSTNFLITNSNRNNLSIRLRIINKFNLAF